MRNVELLTSNGIDVKKSLELFGTMDIYDETLGEFLNGVNEKLANLKKYKEISDMSNYAIYAHSLKSDARYLGFTKLAELAYNHEMQGKANNISFVYDNYDELIEETNRIIKIANEYLGNEVVQKVEKPVGPRNNAILVVDDSDLITNFIYKIFNDTFEVITAHDGKEAIDILTTTVDNRIKGILLDLNMPNINGFEVLDFFNDNNLFIKYPVSIITGADDKSSIDKAFTYPIIDMLQKPFNERDVKRVVEKTIMFNK